MSFHRPTWRLSLGESVQVLPHRRSCSRTPKLHQNFLLGKAQKKVFFGIIKTLLQDYLTAEGIFSRPSAHQSSWDASFTQIYREELASPRSDPTRAVLQARRKLGQPRPSAKQRYQIEAIAEMVRIRFAMAQVAEALRERTPAKNDGARGCWTSLAMFLLYSAMQVSLFTSLERLEQAPSS